MTLLTEKLWQTHAKKWCFFAKYSVILYFVILCYLRGVTWKSGPGIKSSIFSANIRPTETYYIPNQWKLIKVFDELCRFKITALIE